MPLFPASLSEAEVALRSGDGALACKTVRSVLGYPAGAELATTDFARSLAILSSVGDDVLTRQTRQALCAASADPTDVQALFAVGYLLNAAGLPLVAATVLARANALAPNIAELVNQLVSALGRTGLHPDAYEVLHASRGARQDNWHSRLAYSFHALLSGRVIEARQGFALLGPPIDEATRISYEQMTTYFERHGLLSSSRLLHDWNLRSWHYVLSGGLLTHHSPDSTNRGMGGRYAFRHDTNDLIYEGVTNANRVLESWSMSPPRIVYSNDRSSEVLAHVWHKHTGKPIEPFLAQDLDRPGLFVAYDLAEATPDFVQAVAVRRPRQLLVSHATCWTTQSPVTSDITTLLHETNVAPWGARLEFSTDTQRLEHCNADSKTPAEVLADGIIATEVSYIAAADLGEVTTLAELVGPPPTSGERDRFFVGSPVHSCRFV